MSTNNFVSPQIIVWEFTIIIYTSKVWYLLSIQHWNSCNQINAFIFHSEVNPYRTELVFQISSYFQHWRLHCIYFGHCSLSLPQIWLLFRHGVLLLPPCLLGLESPQALCRIKSNAVLSLFWLELWGKKWPRCMLVPAKPMISGFTAREMTQVHTRACGGGHWNLNLCGRRGGTAPFEPPLTGGHPPLKFLLWPLFRAKGGRKTCNFLAIFIGLCLIPITRFWRAS